MQRCNRWIGQAGINITDFLKIKQSGRVVGITKIGDRGSGKRPNRFDIDFMDGGARVALAAATPEDMEAWCNHMMSVISEDWMTTRLAYQ